MTIATKVIVGEQALAADFNNLVDAVQDVSGGHDHSSAENRGKPVAHANLTGVTDGLAGGHTHTQIDDQLDLEAAHRTATGGVHGQPANSYLVGYQSPGKVFAAGWWQTTSDPASGNGNGRTITVYRPGTTDLLFNGIDGVICSCGRTGENPDATAGYPVAFAEPYWDAGQSAFVLQANCVVKVFWLAWGNPR